jgi:hypothetical protein
MVNAPKDLDRLQGKLSSLETTAPPRPRDLRLLHGLYWGFAEGASERHAFCPACAAQSLYVPLSRSYRASAPSYARIEKDDLGLPFGQPHDSGVKVYGTTDEEVSFLCPKCRQRFYLKPDQEREALGS